MNVSIRFPPEIEPVLIRRAAAAGQDVETFVREVVTEQLADEVAVPARVGSHSEFMARLQAIIDMHPASNGVVDDRRESI